MLTEQIIDGMLNNYLITIREGDMMVTAEEVYDIILSMALEERIKLLAIIGRYGFEKETYTHDEVFGDLKEPFTLRESAEFLNISIVTLRRWLKQGKLPCRKIGRTIVIDTSVLKDFMKNNLVRH